MLVDKQASRLPLPESKSKSRKISVAPIEPIAKWKEYVAVSRNCVRPPTAIGLSGLLLTCKEVYQELLPFYFEAKKTRFKIVQLIRTTSDSPSRLVRMSDFIGPEALRHVTITLDIQFIQHDLRFPSTALHPLATLTNLKMLEVRICWQSIARMSTGLPEPDDKKWPNHIYITSLMSGIISMIKPDVALKWCIPENFTTGWEWVQKLDDEHYWGKGTCLRFLDAKLLQKIASKYQYLRGTGLVRSEDYFKVGWYHLRNENMLLILSQ